jgi:hypothetical protein
MRMESHGGMTLTGETRRTRRKSCSSATLSIANSTWTDPGANKVLRGMRPATNHLSHGTTYTTFVFMLCSRSCMLLVPVSKAAELGQPRSSLLCRISVSKHAVKYQKQSIARFSLQITRITASVLKPRQDCAEQVVSIWYHQIECRSCCDSAVPIMVTRGKFC